jgi:predicted amidohydrolase YtcJ
MIPEIEDDLAIKYFGELQKECFAFGLTSLHDCGITEHTLSLLEKSQKQNVLKMNVFALLEDNPNYYEKWLKKGRYTTGKSQLEVLKFMQTELWEVEVRVC